MPYAFYRRMVMRPKRRLPFLLRPQPPTAGEWKSGTTLRLGTGQEDTAHYDVPEGYKLTDNKFAINLTKKVILSEKRRPSTDH